jgi:hypothetical protein
VGGAESEDGGVSKKSKAKVSVRWPLPGGGRVRLKSREGGAPASSVLSGNRQAGVFLVIGGAMLEPL